HHGSFPEAGRDVTAVGNFATLEVFEQSLLPPEWTATRESFECCGKINAHGRTELLAQSTRGRADPLIMIASPSRIVLAAVLEIASWSGRPQQPNRLQGRSAEKVDGLTLTMVSQTRRILPRESSPPAKSSLAPRSPISRPFPAPLRWSVEQRLAFVEER